MTLAMAAVADSTDEVNWKHLSWQLKEQQLALSDVAALRQEVLPLKLAYNAAKAELEMVQESLKEVQELLTKERSRREQMCHKEEELDSQWQQMRWHQDRLEKALAEKESDGRASAQQLEHLKVEVSRIRTDLQEEAAAARRGLDGRTTELCEKLEAVARAVEALGALETRFKRFEADEGVARAELCGMIQGHRLAMEEDVKELRSCRQQDALLTQEALALGVKLEKLEADWDQKLRETSGQAFKRLEELERRSDQHELSHAQLRLEQSSAAQRLSQVEAMDSELKRLESTISDLVQGEALVLEMNELKQDYHEQIRSCNDKLSSFMDMPVALQELRQALGRMANVEEIRALDDLRPSCRALERGLERFEERLSASEQLLIQQSERLAKLEAKEKSMEEASANLRHLEAAASESTDAIRKLQAALEADRKTCPTKLELEQAMEEVAASISQQQAQPLQQLQEELESMKTSLVGETQAEFARLEQELCTFGSRCEQLSQELVEEKFLREREVVQVSSGVQAQLRELQMAQQRGEAVQSKLLDQSKSLEHELRRQVEELHASKEAMEGRLQAEQQRREQKDSGFKEQLESERAARELQRRELSACMGRERQGEERLSALERSSVALEELLRRDMEARSRDRRRMWKALDARVKEADAEERALTTFWSAEM